MRSWIVALALLAPLASAQDVLVILADDIAQEDIDKLAARGVLPNITALADSGMRFVNAYSNPVCSPGRRSFMFGRWWFSESGTGCIHAPSGIEPPLADVSLADLALGAGAVPGLFGKWHLGTNPLGPPWWASPLAHGFSIWHGTPSNVNDCGGQDYNFWMYVDGGFAPPSIKRIYEPRIIEEQLLDWWEIARGPKLGVYASSLAHGPLHQPPADFLPPGYPPANTALLRYEAEIVALDGQVGRILRHVSPETLIVFISDNGTPPQVAPDPTRAKTTTFERGIHVPFILAGADVPRGIVSTRLVHLVDVLPTIADFLGVPPPPGIDGLSVFGPHKRFHVICGTTGNNAPDFCVRTSRWKLRRFGTAPSVAEELYDLAADPEELRPLVPEAHPKVAKLLRDLLYPELP